MQLGSVLSAWPSILALPLNEIKQITRHGDMGESPCDDVRKIIQHRIQENRVKIEEMMKLQGSHGTGTGTVGS